MNGEPTISKQIVGGFRWMLPRIVKKRFHAFAVNRQSLVGFDIRADDCLVVYANHASWWDPITAMLLADRIFGGFRMYAPIDADALEKYKIFKKMGFFGIEQGTQRGAADFLKTSRIVLARPGASIWLTPEGRFADPRDREADLMPGLAHLASKLASHKNSRAGSVGGPTWSDGPRVWMVPVAIEYPFWEESNPELLAWFGQPYLLRSDAAEAEMDWQDKRLAANTLAQALRGAQDQLAAASIARDSNQFEVLLGGKSGTVGIYDLWRKAKASLKGAERTVAHSDKLK